MLVTKVYFSSHQQVEMTVKKWKQLLSRRDAGQPTGPGKQSIFCLETLRCLLTSARPMAVSPQ